MNREALQVIALANKAGKLTAGEDGVLESIRSGNALLVVVSGDASLNTKKRFSDKCRYYGVERIEGGEKAVFGGMLGKRERSVIAFTDGGLTQLFLKKLN